MPRLSVAIALLAMALATACHRPARRDVEARTLIAANCASCHQVPGVRNARGMVGPPLDGVARRTTLAGRLPNSRANMTAFLLHPQAVVPGGAMPEMGLTRAQAAAITRYLYDREDG